MHELLHYWTWMQMIFHFEIAQWGPNIVHPITTLELIVLNHINVWSKNLGQDLTLKGPNIFVGILKVIFLALGTKKSIFAFIARSIVMAQNAW